MQSGGRRRHRAALAGVHRLVAGAVPAFLRPANIGWKGDVTQPVHDGIEVALVFEAHHPQSPFAPFENDRLQLAAAELQPLSNPNPATRLDQRFPGIRSQRPYQEHFDGCFQDPSRGRLVAGQSGAVSDQTGREHLGVVQNKEIPGGQQVRQLGEAVVGDPAGGSNQS